MSLFTLKGSLGGYFGVYILIKNMERNETIIFDFKFVGNCFINSIVNSSDIFII
jgi:hypothetical protein